MRADGRTVPLDEEVTTDVCVIGGGPAGLTLARELGRAGRDVVLLERGAAEGAGLLEPLATTYAVGLDYDIDACRSGGLGGSSHKWLIATPLGDGFGRVPEFVDDDFVERESVPHSGWPFTKPELARYYPAARALFDDVPWPSPAPEEAWDHAFARAHTTGRLDGIEARVFAFANPAVFGGAMKRQLEHSERVLVLTDAAALEFVGGDDGSKVDHLLVATDREHRFRVTAATYVLAAGAIESARLLLSSRAPWTAGLGNQHDLVGRYFMEHPRFTAGYLVPSSSTVLADRRVHAITMEEGVPLQAKYRLDPSTAAAERVANHIYFLQAGPWSMAAVAAREGWNDAPGILAMRRLKRAIDDRRLPDGLHRLLIDVSRDLPRIERRFHVQRRLNARREHASQEQSDRPEVLTIEVMAEQHPNPHSRVFLLEETDQFGAPRAALDWQLTADEIGGFTRSLARFGRSLEEAGIGQVYGVLHDDAIPEGLHGASHHMGTTRMHRDPRHGVVDADCRVHGIDNVYVAGSSVFPTGGAANPTLTLLALTLRLVDHLLRQP